MSEHPVCDRCELLPRKLTGDIDLYVSTPVLGTRRKLVTVLKETQLQVLDQSEVMKVSLPEGNLESLAAKLTESLAGGELEDSRALVAPAGTEPTIADLIHMESLESVISRIRGRSVIDILEHKRLTTYVHPIVDAADPERIFAYECLTRGLDPDGSIVNPGVLFDTARRADLLFYLDREARVTSIRSGAPLAGPAKLFINFNPTTIYTPEYCLATTIATLTEVGLEAKDIVFEVVESDRIDDIDHLLEILSYYRERGFKVALDDLGAGFNSLTTLSQLQPDYMKLDIDLVRDVDRDPFKEAIVRNLLQLAKELGIVSIAEGIERDGEYLWVKNAGADYIQGYLFARPQPVDAVRAG